MITYLFAFLGTAAFGVVWTRLVIGLGIRYRILDHPGLRKVHSTPIPRLGGVAVALPVLAMVAVICAFDNQIGQSFQANRTEIFALLGGSAALLLVGLADDVRGLRAKHKLIAQVATALVVCAFGVRIESIGLGDLGSLQFGFWSWPLTVLWLVGMTNAVNLIDGLDGLAAGITAIAVAVIAIVAITVGQSIMTVLALACLGSLVGFLIFNFNPAKIFLGDSGTYFLGFFLGASSLLTSTKSGTFVGLTLPLLAMGIPIFDTLFAILRRTLERRSLFAPDRNHIHHRLVALGLTQRKAVLVLYLVTLLMTACGLFMLMARDGRSIIFCCLLVLLVGSFRSVGAVRLRETLEKLKRNRGIAREIQEEKEIFQEAELRLREATTFEAWWESLCAAAELFGFAELECHLPDFEGRRQALTWARGPNEQNGKEYTEVSIPIKDPITGRAAQLDARVCACGSIESLGRRLALLGRLVEARE